MAVTESRDSDLVVKKLPEVNDKLKVVRDPRGVICFETSLFPEANGEVVCVPLRFGMVKTQKEADGDSYVDVVETAEITDRDIAWYEFYCPKMVAELMVKDIADQGTYVWNVIIELAQRELLAEKDEEKKAKLTEEIREMNKYPRRVFRASILYSQIVSLQPQLSDQELIAADAVRPDFETNQDREDRNDTWGRVIMMPSNKLARLRNIRM